MKNRILSAALAVAAAVGGTLTLTGTASAQTVIAPPRVTATVGCNNTERGTLVVSITNRFNARATGTVRTPFGTKQNVRVDGGDTETFTFATRQSRVERGTVNVELRSGNARSTISTTYQTTECVAAPNISVSRTSGANGLLDSVTVTNNGDRAIDVTVRAGAQQLSRRIAANGSSTFTLNDTARYAEVRATRTVDNRTYTTTRYVFG